MRRTNVVELKPSRKHKRILKEMTLLSSCVYNMANYETRQAFFNNEKSPSFFDFQQKLQKKEDYQLLGRSYSLPRLQVYGETNNARFKLVKSKTQTHVGLPKYLKNRKTNTTIPSYLVIDGCQYAIGKKKATIPLSRKLREKYDIKRFDIPYNGILRWKGIQQRGQIMYKNKKFYLYQSVEMPNPTPIDSNVSAGIDLGIKNLVTAVTSNGAERIIGSKRFYKQWLYHNKIISDEQAKLALINRSWSHRLQRCYDKRSAYQEQLFNNVIAKTFRVFKRDNVKTIYLGDVSGIRENNDRGAKYNSMLHNYWAYDKLRQKITNKAEEHGMTLVPTTEEYTSRECPVCQERNKPHDRIYVCNFCGNIDHRDVVGATNIMLKGMRDLQWQSAHQGETTLLSGVLV